MLKPLSLAVCAATICIASAAQAEVPTKVHPDFRGGLCTTVVGEPGHPLNSLPGSLTGPFVCEEGSIFRNTTDVFKRYTDYINNTELKFNIIYVNENEPTAAAKAKGETRGSMAILIQRK